MRTSTVLLRFLLLIAVASFAYADTFQGFEVDTEGWILQGNSITRVLGPAASGDYYAVITKANDSYQPGWGVGGFGRPLATAAERAVYNGGFFQSLAVYVDPAWAPAGEFWLDMAAANSATGGSDYGSEHNFRFNTTGSQVNITVDGGSLASPLLSIMQPGWYTFEMTWRKAPDPNAPVLSDMNIYDYDGNLLASDLVEATSPGGPMESSDLGGPSYMWMTVWKNGAAGDSLKIDNMQYGLLEAPVPEPATFGIGGVLLLGLAALRKARKR